MSAYNQSFPIVQDIFGNPSLPRVPLPNALVQHIIEAISEENVQQEADFESYTQKALSLKIDLRNQHMYKLAIERNSDDQEMARVGSINLPHSGDWLNVRPTPALGTHIPTSDFVACLQYRMGVSVYQAQTHCVACGAEMDSLGDHTMNCQSGGQRNRRHN